jgi:hypothetical protein
MQRHYTYIIRDNGSVVMAESNFDAPPAPQTNGFRL